MTCEELQTRFEAEVAALDTSCSPTRPCTSAGGADHYDECDCNAYLPPHAVNSATYRASRAPGLEAEFRKRCLSECGGAIICICDELELLARCNEAGQCEIDYPACGCGWCGDAGAGVADASVADAGVTDASVADADVTDGG